MNKLRQHLRLFVHCVKYEAMDRFDSLPAFSILAVGALAEMLVTVVFFKSIYLKVDRIGGWASGEVMILLGVYFLINAIAWMTYIRGFLRLPRLIENGDLDSYLTKPVDLRTFLTYRFVDAVFLQPQLIAAVGLIVYGARGAATPLNLPLFLLLLGCGIVVHRSVTVMVGALNFAFIVPNSVTLASAIFDLGRYPIDIYKGAVRLMLSVAVPVAVIYSVPARALAGDLRPAEVAAALAITAVFYVASRAVWDIGLKKYESAKG